MATPDAVEAGEQFLGQAVIKTEDTIRVLEAGGLHPEAVAHLREAEELANKAARSFFGRQSLIMQAIERQRNARAQLVEGF